MNREDLADEIIFAYRREIDNFVKEMLVQMQAAHKKFAAHEAKISKIHQSKPNRAALRKLAAQQIYRRWGDDEMLPLLTRILVDGDFVF